MVNTINIVRNAYKRMPLLTKLYEFNIPVKDLVLIYIIFIRSKLEYACPVWHSGITQEETEDLERVQKSALRVILKEKYTSYTEVLEKLDLQNLETRRKNLCLKFAQDCLKKETMSSYFPLNPHYDTYLRQNEKFIVSICH